MRDKSNTLVHLIIFDHMYHLGLIMLFLGVSCFFVEISSTNLYHFDKIIHTVISNHFILLQVCHLIQLIDFHCA